MNVTTSERILVVGAGFSGSVIARELSEADFKVDVIDSRSHVAGNAYDEWNDHGIRIHKYGPHLFHTNNMRVVDWLSRFTDWSPYKHKVKAMLSDGRLVTLPVNRETMEIVGKENIVDTFFRPYTEKMWGMTLEELDASVLNRVPIRDDMNEYYFPDDKFQALPTDGYTALVRNILDHPNITVSLECAFEKEMTSDFRYVFNSMAIDDYFDCQLGRLPYRSIKFTHVTLPLPKLFPVATVNFTHNGPCTRVTEWKNLPGHGINDHCTTITYEEVCSAEENRNERYYPVPDRDSKNRQLYREYRAMVPPGMTFIGRCGLYSYLDMDQAVASSLTTAKQFLRGCC